MCLIFFNFKFISFPNNWIFPLEIQINENLNQRNNYSCSIRGHYIELSDHDSINYPDNGSKKVNY